MPIKAEEGGGEFHREGGNFRKSESGDRGGETENGKGRKLREKRRGKREEEGEEIIELTTAKKLHNHDIFKQ